MSHETDLAWAAGFFDGDGSVYIASKAISPRGVRYFGLELSISQVDPRPLHKYREMFGGAISMNPRPIHRDWGKWKAGGKNAAIVLRQLLPYLLSKRGEAELALWFAANKSNHKYMSSLHRAEQEAFRDALMEWHRTDLSEMAA